MRKRIVLGLIIVFLLSLGITGCRQEKPVTTPENQAGNNQAATLLVYAGAGIRQPLDEIGKAFEDKYQVQVQYTYAGSAQNCTQISMLKKGDLFVPGSAEDLDPLKAEKMITKEQPLVQHIPVIAVPKDNPAGVKSLEDLTKPGAKVALGDPAANPIGKLADKMLTEQNLLAAVNKNVVVRTPTVNELVVYLSTGQADAAIVWEENVVNAGDKIATFAIPPGQNKIKTIPVAVLSCTETPELADKYVAFCLNEGMNIFTKHGYKPVKKQE
ncbi:MAG: molybdate ABC transporter substrate-binding protein [Heliobacteriaceae bacterium]|nr:molybdate ABC transporter substrate-binding protein [Heliobacteriaceae bacterium]